MANGSVNLQVFFKGIEGQGTGKRGQGMGNRDRGTGDGQLGSRDGGWQHSLSRL